MIQLYLLLHNTASINHVDRFSIIFDPLPPLWTNMVFSLPPKNHVDFEDQFFARIYPKNSLYNCLNGDKKSSFTFFFEIFAAFYASLVHISSYGIRLPPKPNRNTRVTPKKANIWYINFGHKYDLQIHIVKVNIFYEYFF